MADDADGHGRVEAQRIRYAGGICRRSCLRFAGIHTLYPTDGASCFSDVDRRRRMRRILHGRRTAALLQAMTTEPSARETLTREQMAVMLARYAARTGVTAQGQLAFTDAAKISGWAADGVAVCTGLDSCRATRAADSCRRADSPARADRNHSRADGRLNRPRHLLSAGVRQH